MSIELSFLTRVINLSIKCLVVFNETRCIGGDTAAVHVSVYIGFFPHAVYLT